MTHPDRGAPPAREIGERPPGFEGPVLTPTGLELAPRRLGDGAYALLANRPPKNNNGIVHGTHAALVIDAGITPEVARLLQQHAASLTDRPLRYLVNTTYHGDHTFGNATFGADVTVLSARANRENMTDLAHEKAQRSESMAGDDALLDAVTDWRTPDVGFDTYAEIDLGGRLVELHHFGPGNGPGDTVVHVPSARAAWTGNFLPHAGAPTMLLQGGPRPYVESLRRMREALPDLATVVPGHGPAGDARAAIDWMVDYLARLADEVENAYAAGRDPDETYATVSDPWAERLPDPVAAALAEYDVPQGLAREGFRQASRHLHRLNVLATYRSLEAPSPSAPPGVESSLRKQSKLGPDGAPILR